MYQDLAPPPNSSQWDVERLHAQLYDGAIVRFRSLASMAALTALTQDFAEAFFAPHHPTEIHRHVAPAGLAERCAAARRSYGNAGEVKAAWAAVFAEAGLDPDDTARDRLVLRFQPPRPVDGERPWARSTATVDFHRDTWGSNLYAQINWWAPVYPITAGRTFAFYPALFARPLANDSAGFDIADVMRRNREAPETVGKGDMVPHLLEPLDPADARPVVIAPGEIIAFSAQHAHVGVDNVTELTRISLDARTLRISDQRAGRGAPNVDGRAKWVTYKMFRRLSDGASLAEVLGVEGMAAFAGPWPQAGGGPPTPR